MKAEIKIGRVGRKCHFAIDAGKPAMQIPDIECRSLFSGRLSGRYTAFYVKYYVE
jgi:hypothetical protein